IISNAARLTARRSCGTCGRCVPLVICRSAVMLAISTGALLLAYSKCRTWPGCTTSKTPWHMMTFSCRGIRPIRSRISCGVLILCLMRWVSDSSMSSRPLSSQIIEPGLRGSRDRLRIPQRRVLPTLNVPQHHLHPVLEAQFGLPAQHGDDLADIRKGAVGFPRTLRQIDYLAAEEPDKLVDRPRIPGADVEPVAGVLGLGRGEEGL